MWKRGIRSSSMLFMLLLSTLLSSLSLLATRKVLMREVQELKKFPFLVSATPGILRLRGGVKTVDHEELREKSEAFWLPVINKLDEKTKFWEPYLRNLIELEASGEWGRLEPGEQEEDEDEVDLDVILGKDKLDEEEEDNGVAELSSGVNSAPTCSESRLASARLAQKLGGNSTNATQIEEQWWESVDKDAMDREEILAFLQETACGGEGPHSWVGQRFGGKRHRNRAMYASDNETDEDMLHRHFAGYLENETAAGLHRLEVATKCDDFQEIEELVLRCGVPVDGFTDTLGQERALHLAAWYGHRAAARKLLILGADPNSRNYYNQTPMHRAAANGALGIVEDLIDAGAEPLPVDAYNCTPGWWAADANQNQTCQWLFARYIHPAADRFPLGPPPHYGLPPNAGFDYFAHGGAAPEPPEELHVFHDMMQADGDGEWAPRPTDAELETRLEYIAAQNEQLAEAEAEAAASETAGSAERAVRREELHRRRVDMVLGPQSSQEAPD